MDRHTKHCHSCKELVAIDAQKCPSCGVHLSYTATDGAIGCVLAILLIGGLIWAMQSCSAEPEKTAQELELEAEEAERRRFAGLHCLSGWDGSNADLVRRVKLTLRDPDSFEHAKTIIRELNPDGEHPIIMRYRARNGFGGITIGYARGVVSNATCDARVLEIE